MNKKALNKLKNFLNHKLNLANKIERETRDKKELNDYIQSVIELLAHSLQIISEIETQGNT